MKKPLIVILIACLLHSCAEPRVESQPYDAMLELLLSHSVKEITIAGSDEINDPIFLDTRSIEEFNVSHIKEAKFIDYETLNFKVLDSLQKDEEIIVYCSVGYRSEIVCEKLLELGFTNVSNLYGGLFEWVNQSKPIVDTEGNFTNRVHAYDQVWGIWLKKGDKVY